MATAEGRSAVTETDTGESPLLRVVRQGAVLRGLVGPEPVTIMVVARLTDDSANVVYKTEAGGLGERMVFASDLPRLSVVGAGAAFSFDGEPSVVQARGRGTTDAAGAPV